MILYKFQPRISLILGLSCWFFLLLFQLTLIVVEKTLNIYSYYFTYHFFLGLSILFTYNYYDQKLKFVNPNNVLVYLDKTFKFSLLSIIPVGIIWIILFYILSGNYITRNISVLNIVNHVTIGISLTYLSIIFTVYKRFILFDNEDSLTKSLWKIFEHLIFFTFLFDFVSVFFPSSFYYIIGFVVIIYGFILSFNLKWIAYISFDKKWKSIVYIFIIIISLFFYFRIFLQINVTGIVIFDLTKSLYFMVASIFILLYSLISILVNVFNLPTSTVFEKFQKEQLIARKVQEALIPKSLPNTKKLKIFSTYNPHSDLGGDYFDYIPLNKNQFIVCIADVSGKGMPAALLMSNFQASLRTLLRYTKNLNNIVNELNFQINSKESGDRFVSFFIAEFDIKKKTINYVNCGHPPPILKSEDKLINLDKGTTLIGVFNELPKFNSHRIKYKNNCLLLCYTDGLLETQNDFNDYYGEERLESFVLSSKTNHENINKKILDDLNDFKGSKSYNDDITILTINTF